MLVAEPKWTRLHRASAGEFGKSHRRLRTLTVDPLDVDGQRRDLLLGTLTIGFLAQPTGKLLPDLLVAYRERHPHVDIELRELPNQEQVDALLRGRLDVALMTHRVQDPRVRAIALERIRVGVAMPAGHRLAEHKSVRLQELVDEPWVYPIGSSGPLYGACVKAGFEPRIAQQATEHAARLALFAAGLGLTIDIESAARPPSSSVVYRPLTDPAISIDLVAAGAAARATKRW